MANKKTILITGANGQLGKEFRTLASSLTQYNFLFTTKENLPIENAEMVNNYFANNSIDFCVNCAAYTAVDKAETEKEKAYLINATAVENIAKACQKFKVQLIHISTDYVFDGTNNEPYKETDTTHPQSVYGHSKLEGEVRALQNNPSAIIVRTSWVYSSFGNNFVKTMLRFMKEKESINVVDDQYGCPTYAADLANAIMEIIGKSLLTKTPFSIFNYCNQGIVSWYQFAVAIKELSNSKCIVNPIPTVQYPTAAKRPQYSVLDTTKISTSLNITIPQWKESLIKCMQLLS